MRTWARTTAQLDAVLAVSGYRRTLTREQAETICELYGVPMLDDDAQLLDRTRIAQHVIETEGSES